MKKCSNEQLQACKLGFKVFFKKNPSMNTQLQCFMNHFKKVSTVCGPKIDMWPRIMLLIKNPQFLANFFETWSK